MGGSIAPVSVHICKFNASILGATIESNRSIRFSALAYFSVSLKYHLGFPADSIW